MKLMTCEQAKNQLPDYLIGNLDERTNTELHSHLTNCASCRTEVESLRSIWADLQLLPAEQPSEALRARFYAMLHAYQQGLAHKQPGVSWGTRLNRWLERWWPKQPAFQFAFAVVFLIFGVIVGQRMNSTEQEQPQNDSEIAQLRQEVHTMREMVTLSLLQQQSASERLKGVSWFHRVEQPDREVLSALLNTLSYDPNVNVRLAAVDALNQFADRTLVREGLVQALARQTSPLVQIELIDLLVQKREKQAMETLTQLIRDEQINQAVKQRAEWGIEQLR
jgi:anti-sigma factor RsiW